MSKYECKPENGWTPPVGVPRDMYQACKCPQMKQCIAFCTIGMVLSVFLLMWLATVPVAIGNIIGATVLVIGTIGAIALYVRGLVVQHQWNREPWYYPHTTISGGNEIFPPYPRR